MRPGIFAKTFAGSDPRIVLDAVAGAGFAATQYNMSCSGLASMPEAIGAGTAAAIRDAAAEAGVEIVALSGTFNMIHPDPAVRHAGLRRLAALAEAAPAIGTGLITLCTGTRDPDDQWRAHLDNATPEAWRDLTASMEAAIAIAEAADIALGIEPERANVISSAKAARRLIDEMASPRLRIVFDAANLVEDLAPAAQHATISRGLGLLADRLALVHAKDRCADGSFATAGTGILDYGHYIGELRRIGFDGAIVAHGLATAEAPAVAQFLGRIIAAS